MKKIILALIFAFCSINCLASNAVTKLEDENISFVLNKLSILLEFNNPKAFPAKTRLISIPDKSDRCEWAIKNKNIPTSIAEDGCPKKMLLLTLTNWDIEPSFYTFNLGNALSWEAKSYEVTERKNMSHWDALLVVQKRMISEKGISEVLIRFKIKNRSDIYTVELIKTQP